MYAFVPNSEYVSKLPRAALAIDRPVVFGLPVSLNAKSPFWLTVVPGPAVVPWMKSICPECSRYAPHLRM